MNKARRKALDEVLATLESAREMLENVKDEEQEAYDNLPESLQATDRGQGMEVAIGFLEDAMDYVDNAVESCSSAQEG